MWAQDWWDAYCHVYVHALYANWGFQNTNHGRRIETFTLKRVVPQQQEARVPHMIHTGIDSYKIAYIYCNI